MKFDSDLGGSKYDRPNILRFLFLLGLLIWILFFLFDLGAWN